MQEALERALAEGVPYLILDGKVVDTDRCREKTVSRKGEVIDLWYAGKTHDFGGNVQALFYPSGIPLWVSDVLPGNVHDLAAARENVRVGARTVAPVDQRVEKSGRNKHRVQGDTTRGAAVEVGTGGIDHRDVAEQPPAHLAGVAGEAVEPTDP